MPDGRDAAFGLMVRLPLIRGGFLLKRFGSLGRGAGRKCGIELRKNISSHSTSSAPLARYGFSLWL